MKTVFFRDLENGDEFECWGDQYLNYNHPAWCKCIKDNDHTAHEIDGISFLMSPNDDVFLPEEIKKTSKEWYEEIPEEYGLTILDPDGWDRKNYDYSFNEELITKEEFDRRLGFSTIQCKTSFFTGYH